MLDKANLSAEKKKMLGEAVKNYFWKFCKNSFRRDDKTINFFKFQNLLKLSPESTSISNLLSESEAKEYENWMLGFESNIKSYDEALKDEETAIQNTVPIELPTDHEYNGFVEL